MTKTEQYHLERGDKPTGCKTCMVCQTSFNIFNRHEEKRKKFCSTTCQHIDLGKRTKERQLNRLSPKKGKRYKPREKRLCDKCNEPFEILLTNKADRARRFCSRKCSLGMTKGLFVGDKSPVWTERVTIKCEACGNSFQDYAARKKRMKTCSKECANKLLERPAIHVCLNCGIKTETTEYHARNQKYCSRRCLFEAMPTANTSIEKKIKELIKDVPTAKHGYQFHRFTVDFAIPALKIFIECDGTYWHSLPAAIQRDQEKDRMAAEDGWFMLRLTEKEINEDIAGCEAKIKRAIALRAAETSDPIVTLDLTLSES